MNQIMRFIDKNKYEVFLLILVLLVGAVLRLYRISEYMTFLGDEGRDAIIVRRLLVNFDPILVGPGTSVGDMYLGPFYYYLMAPALFLANYSPVGPAVMVALFSVATVFFIWFVVRKWFHKGTNVAAGALSAALLYALSPVIINQSRFSWNPNIMPFFALLVIYSLWKVYEEHEWKWLTVSAVALSIALQSHYLALILVPLYGINFILALKNSWFKGNSKVAIKHSLLSVFIFLLIMSPLVIFDARHGWRNFEAMRTFFTSSSDVNVSLASAIANISPAYEKIIARLLGGGGMQYESIAVGIFTLILVWLLFINREKYSKQKISAYILVFSWFVIGITGLALYRNELYDHYFGFLFPAPFILLGGVLNDIDKNYKFGVLVVVFTTAILAFLSISNTPLLYPPSGQMQRTINVATKITEEAGAMPFNIAVIAEQNYEGAYWYFLESWGTPIVGIDPLRADETITQQLFVVCEYEDISKCQPTSNPKTEVANFGWSKIDEQWVVDNVVLFKLSHNFPANLK